MKWTVLLLSLILICAPESISAQKRQRSKSKVKTTSVSKKNTNTKKEPTTSAEAKKKQAETQKEIQLTQEQIKENEKKVSKELSALGQLDVQIDSTTSKIKVLNTKIGKLNGEISTLEVNVKKNESRLQQLRDEYLKAVKKMRVTRKNKSDMAFIFSSKSLSQAMRRMRYLREFSDWKNRQTKEINGEIAHLNSQKESLSKVKEEQQSAVNQHKIEEKKLNTQKKDQEQLLAQLKQNGAALQSHLKKKKEEAAQLGNIVSKLIAEEQRKAEEEERQRLAAEEAKQKALEEQRRKEEEVQLLAQKEEKTKETNKPESSRNEKIASGKSTKKETLTKQEKGQKSTDYADARKRTPRSNSQSKTSGTTKNTTSTTSNTSSKTNKNEVGGTFPEMKGKLPYPVSGSFTITSRFGRQNLPDLPDVEFDNPGIDAKTETGASAKAVYKGKVSGVYLLPGYNTVVIVNHGNYYTVYGNISQPKVKTGDNVEAGTSIGTLAAADDDSDGASIHFEVWKNREKLNPQEWLR